MNIEQNEMFEQLPAVLDLAAEGAVDINDQRCPAIFDSVLNVESPITSL